MKLREEIHLVYGRPLRLRLRRSGRARHLRLTVSRRSGAEVVLPHWASRRDVDELLAQAADWLQAQVIEHDVWNGPRRRNWATGSELPLLGRSLRLDVRSLPDGRERPRIEVDGECLRLELPADLVLDPRPVLDAWLRRFAGRHLRERTAVLGRRLHLQPQRVVVGERTSRWGSCTTNGTISYCYRLVMAPAPVVDAVVIHELCHLEHVNHGPQWRARVERAYPDHALCMAWLRDHGGELEL